MRLAVTSDLHYDPRGDLTPPERVRALARRIAGERPDAVVLAGDLAHGLAAFDACVACFEDVGAPVAVLAGNHDVWRDEETKTGSEALWSRRLREVTQARGAHWLEDAPLRVGDVAVVGTMAWYDYSAMDPTVRATPEQAEIMKRMFNNDAAWIDWPWTDRALARSLGDAMMLRLAAVVADETVRAVAVVTHVPVLEAQMERRPDDSRWGFSNAYFGNLTLGARVMGAAKLRAVVSGHTHAARRATLAAVDGGAVDVRVIGSDYGAPAYVIVEV